MATMLDYIDCWEQNLLEGKIKEEEFLTSNTAEGLRVTISSTIELSKYLLNDCGFHYILTNKMNQDTLEVNYTTIILKCLNIICICFIILYFSNHSYSLAL